MLGANEQITAGVESGGAGWKPGSAAEPVAIGSTIGLYTAPADGTQAQDRTVLFLSPWGFEEMCTRKLWRILAEGFSRFGVASLRFDYPGTGDASDDADLSAGLAAWEEATVAAAAELRRLSGATRLILVGHGLGANLAARWADRLGAVDGAVLMAPVISGRAYLRELAAWSRMIDDGLGLREDQRVSGGVSVAGLLMPDEVAADVRSLNLDALEKPPAPQILSIERPSRDKEAALSLRLEALGAEVTRVAYDGYDNLVSNPTIARQPETVIDHVTRWVGTLASNTRPVANPPVPAEPAALPGRGYIEEALRFGPGQRLSGMLCLPLGERRGATVILLGTAYDRHAGWARSTVEAARQLARQGIASLRFDGANCGDSPALPGMVDQDFYDDRHRDDVRAAIDLIERRGLAPTILAGRCSGAYLAFQAALHDERCRGAVIINPFTFQWDDSENVEEGINGTPRSLDDYKRRARSGNTVRRLLSGEIDIRGAAASIAIQLGRRVLLSGPPALSGLSRLGRRRNAVHAGFSQLAARKVMVRLIYSVGDVGLDRFQFFFGLGGTGLSAYPNVTWEICEDADHNMTPQHAQTLMRERIAQTALAAARL